MFAKKGYVSYFELDMFAGGLDQFAELHARRTGCLTRPTTEAAIHMIYKFGGDFHATVGNCLHLVNAPTRGIHLYAQYRVSWTCWQTKTAVDTLAYQFIGVGLAT